MIKFAKPLKLAHLGDKIVQFLRLNICYFVDIFECKLTFNVFIIQVNQCHRMTSKRVSLNNVFLFFFCT